MHGRAPFNMYIPILKSIEKNIVSVELRNALKKSAKIAICDYIKTPEFVLISTLGAPFIPNLNVLP